MGKIFKEFNPKKWEQVRTHPYFAPMREATLAQAEKFMREDPPVIKFSLIHRYVTDGNREVFERVYEDYFHRLNTYFVSYMLTEDEKYLTPLSDIIWNICDFESWSIPAHVREELTVAERRQNLDLCSTIAGFRISEVLYFIGDKLPALVVKRARAEVRYRVIESYRNSTVKRFSWFAKKDNWSAVCIAAVLATYLYAAEDDEIKTQLPRMIESAECYLKGFDDEGCCLEGYGYWNYGFSFFCVFASLLSEYTDGEIDYFKNPKVARIARFQETIPLNEKQCVSFSDSGMDFAPYPWLSHFLKVVYPDLRIPAIPPHAYAGVPLRYILWQNPDFATSSLDATEPVSFTYENAQWFIYRCADYSLGCKAGHNKEQHNHNDVGSFIVSKGGRITFCDPGVGQYNAQYFSNRRYELMLCSSRGHSVPVINGKYQVCSGEKAEIVAKGTRRYAFTMENAYDDPTLERLTRDFECRDGCIRLTDTYTFTEQPTSVTERFISLMPIDVCDGKLVCGDSELFFDASLLDAAAGSEEVERKGSRMGTVYYADLTVKHPEKNMNFEFIIK